MSNHRILTSQDIISDNFEIRLYQPMFNRLLTRKVSIPIPIQVVMICAVNILKYRQKEETRNFYTCPYTLLGNKMPF